LTMPAAGDAENTKFADSNRPLQRPCGGGPAGAVAGAAPSAPGRRGAGHLGRGPKGRADLGGLDEYA
ncbi:hypothetical protein, partial [Phocaeicola dorei]|uniref:hypothetical protein n=1 Tax=Phocaeicola dorei TaxID=357276 RepID=UPI00321A45D8